MLKTFKQRFRWQAANFDRMVSHRLNPGLDPDLRSLVDTLRTEGYVTCDARQFLGPDAGYYDALRDEVMTLWKSDDAQQKALHNAGEKDFKVRLLDLNIRFGHPIMKLSLHPRILAVANEYMGMRSYLRQLDLWWDRPTPNEAAASQLWHRDLDDARNVKVFIYFNDVDAQTGPFSFLPKTHMFGRYAGIQPGGSNKNRFKDEEMVGELSLDEAKMITGKAGTMIFCDTYGFHRGFKPEKDRLMSIFQYVSKASKYPRDFSNHGDSSHLNAVQRQSLDPLPV